MYLSMADYVKYLVSSWFLLVTQYLSAIKQGTLSWKWRQIEGKQIIEPKDYFHKYRYRQIEQQHNFHIICKYGCNQRKYETIQTFKT